MSKYKIVSCAGFGYTGSSIVSDYLSEFENVNTLAGSFEFRFLHDFGGISTLEDCLVHNYHKQSSDGAIHQYLQMVDYLSGNLFSRKYSKYFGGKFRELSYQFIDEITDAKWKGFMESTAMFKHPLKRIVYYQIYPRLKKLINGGGNVGRFYPKRDMYFSSPNKEYFDRCVRTYLNCLFEIIDPNNEKDYLYFDQIVPPSNINRYLDYFDNIKIVVVDRDPRDIYVQNTYLIKESWIPSDVGAFIKLYKGQRNNISREKDNTNILRIRFEDAIYKYEDFCNMINRFLGLSERQHINQKRYFDPQKSMENTRLWEKNNVDMKEIQQIKDSLYEYCYNYDKLNKE